MTVPATIFPPNETENTLYPLQTSIWTHQTQASGKQPGEAGQLTAVALVKGDPLCSGLCGFYGNSTACFCWLP